MLRRAASLLAPPLCGICGSACDSREGVCSGCARAVARLEPSRAMLPCGLEVLSAAPYEGVARQLVSRIKFSARLPLAAVAAERMIRAWGAVRRGWLVSVPPAPARERGRGFDPAHVLARLIACECRDARTLSCLARGDGPRQVGRPRAERIADPPRIRMLRAAEPLPHGDLWLVDDVVTTGATLAACATALRGAGATRVRALTFARAI